MRYKVIETVEVQEWQKIVDRNPFATFFHTPAWAKILCETFPKWKIATFGIEFEDGVSVIIPLLQRSIMHQTRFCWYESMAPGTYGGPISNVELTSKHCSIISDELEKYSNILVTSNPFESWQFSNRFTTQNTFTHIIHLKKDFSEVAREFSKGRRDAIRFAKRKGVTIKETDFFNNYERYYEIYKDQIKRWGKEAGDYYPIRLFFSLAHASKNNSGIKVWSAYLNEQMIGGVIALYHQKHLALWHGVCLSDYLRLRPVDLLYSAVIEDACANGYQYFDFGKSGGHEGVAEYKEHFGAKRLQFTVYRRRNAWGLSYRLERHLKNYMGRCPED